MVTRIYFVSSDTEKRLIEATSGPQAVRHCVKNKYHVKPATPKEVAQFLASGVAVEKANDSAVDQSEPFGD